MADTGIRYSYQGDVDTGWMTGGFCAGVGCLAAERGYADLKAPVVRIGLPDVPTPAGYTLEQYSYPDAARIAAAAAKLVGHGQGAEPIPAHSR